MVQPKGSSADLVLINAVVKRSLVMKSQVSGGNDLNSEKINFWYQSGLQYSTLVLRISNYDKGYKATKQLFSGSLKP